MPAHPHCHWRGAKDWEQFGLEFSTTSDEACKMYDATLTQIVNHYDDASIGGAGGCLQKMLEADPNFLMGHVLKNGLSGTYVYKNFNVAQDVYKMAELAKQPSVKPWERKHAEAVQYLCEGKTSKACCVWEDILVEKPTDMLSIKFLHDMYIGNALSRGLHDSCGRVLPYWKQEWPLYGDLLGMYAFGQEEINLYSQAEKNARKALDINRFNGWAAHCVSHCKEMTGQLEEGIKFMAETENNWNDTALLCHNYWHWALYYYEMGDFESARGILNSHVLPFMKEKKSMFSVTDAAALCFRLQAEGFDVGSGFEDCYNVAKDHVHDNYWSFFDIGAMLSFVGAGKKPECDALISGVKKTIKDGDGEMPKLYEEVTLPILEAIQAYSDEDYDKAVEIMRPLRYEMYRAGGSHAQRDVFNIFAIHAALQARIPENRKYASHLLMERKCHKETPLAERLLQRLIASH